MVRVMPTALLASAAALATAVQALDFHCYGINYNIRNGPDWAPAETKCKKADLIQQELVKLKTVTDIIRLYSLTDCDQGNIVIPAAIKAGLKIELGLWVGPEQATFNAEKDAFQKVVANKDLVNNKNIVGVHVGSEAVYRGDVEPATAIKYLDEIRKISKAAGLDVPHTIADVGDMYLDYPELIEAVDYVSANMFPFWEKIDVEEAVDYFYTRIQDLETAAKAENKSVVIGETGWPSSGVNVNASDASPAAAALYFQDFYNMAHQHDFKYYYFAGFDEAWKGTDPENTVEAHFGIFDASGKLKTEFETLKLNDKTPAPSSKTPAPSSKAPGKDTPAPTSKTPGKNTPAPTKDGDASDDDDTPAPSSKTPGKMTPAPTTKTPGKATPAPTSGKGDDDDDNTPAPTTKKPGKATPAPTSGKGDDDDDNTPAPTTKKPGKATPAPTSGKGDDDDDNTPAPTTKTPGKVTPAPTVGKGGDDDDETPVQKPTPSPTKGTENPIATGMPTPAPTKKVKPGKDCKAE
ncbi:hypothetical protein Poli38472_012193 [Pythium oligandrum]|uniref:glucan endo-1,3-beta-D-glucosidase n=1 Tax=Pythium oligandrum TaxID=41045 RepID=A0A8K1CR02_PYTOL|nr:hypothetical protein Poli38472_012193 [Pythium oligandrum]|eukprot:TMW67077.1 hypothetical protein Poli38472_012193 [Pythium oligandrum]